MTRCDEVPGNSGPALIVLFLEKRFVYLILEAEVAEVAGNIGRNYLI